MKLAQLIKDKRVQYGGVAAAGVLGVFVLLRRKQTTGTTRADVASQVGTGQRAQAQFDSTGTDVANWLGNYSGNLQNQLDAYQQQLTNSLAGLSKVPNEGPANAIPGTPEGLRGITWGTHWADFGWTPVVGASYYEVMEPDSTIRRVLGNTAVFGGAQGGDLQGDSYTLQVRAVNDAGTSPWATYTQTLNGGTH